MKSENKYTIISFYFIPNNNIDKINFKDFNSNELKFYSSVEEEKIYYNEIISFHLHNKPNSNSSLISIYYPIYINKINNIYIDSDKLINEDKLFITAEILIQGTNRFILPKNISYDGENLIFFDFFQNTLKKRIGIINFNPKKSKLFKKILDYNFEDGNSYKIILRYYEKDKFEISVSSFELINDINIKKKFKQFQGNKKDIISNLKKLCYDFKLLIKDINKAMKINENDIKKFNEDYLKEFTLVDLYYENMKDYNNFDELDISIFHYLLYYKELLLFLKMKNDKFGDLVYSLEYFEKINDFYEDKIANVIGEKYENIKDCLSLIKAYNNHILNSLKTFNKIDDMSFINIAKLKKNNPYFIAVNFVEQIINNLEEHSRLYEILSSLDSEVITNLIIENKDINTITYNDIYGNTRTIKYGKNPTEYGLNLLNVKEIKDHLIKLIPKYIIRLNTDMKFRANYSLGSNIMSINEKSLFKKDSIRLNKIFDNNDSNEKYAIPIIIEILHELYGHYKKRLINSKESSPLEMRDSKYNYKRIKIMKYVNKGGNTKEKINAPESGIALEHYISENPKIIKWLKTPCDNNNVMQILDVSLWVDTNFNKLENIIKKMIDPEGGKGSDINTGNLEDQDFESDDSDLYDCGFVHSDGE